MQEVLHRTKSSHKRKRGKPTASPFSLLHALSAGGRHVTWLQRESHAQLLQATRSSSLHQPRQEATTAGRLTATHGDSPTGRTASTATAGCCTHSRPAGDRVRRRKE